MENESVCVKINVLCCKTQNSKKVRERRRRGGASTARSGEILKAKIQEVVTRAKSNKEEESSSTAILANLNQGKNTHTHSVTLWTHGMERAF